MMTGRAFSPGTAANPGATSLLALDNAWNDLMAHELAHQWWGGLVSWETVSDNWITEGLATYSSLLFLKECRGEKAFARVLRRFRNDVKRYAGLGVPADGSKLKLLHRDIRIYQALVYAKPALMLAALADTIGEAELCGRLRGFLAERRGRNVGTAEFLARLSAGDERLAAAPGGVDQRPRFARGTVRPRQVLVLVIVLVKTLKRSLED